MNTHSRTLNLIIVVLEILGFIQGVSLNMFIYYTNLSNLIALMACLFFLYVSISKKESLRNIAGIFKYIATCMTSLTFVVVLCILVPMQGIQMIYQGNFVYFHLLCPILMGISFVFFDDIQLDTNKSLFGLIPTLIYAIIAIVCNLIGVLVGPYPFLMVTKQPVYMSILWCVVVIGLAYGMAYFLLRKKKRMNHVS